MTAKTPAEILQANIETAKAKAALPGWKMVWLGIFAGLFIGFGSHAFISATVIADTAHLALSGKMIGALLFPTGTYFLPFLFEEIAGGVLFALFYYRARLSTMRVVLGRFAVTVICNLILNPLFLMWYYAVYLGKAYRFMTWPRLAKNLVLFPVQSIVLVLLFRLLLPLSSPTG
jgi:formate/nitrite transporter FocA (FNT family)